MAEEIHRGACLCGGVRFRASGELEPVVCCHCTMCRRQTGHYLATTNVAEARLSIDGGGNLRWHASSDHAERGFCGLCGSFLFWRWKGSGRIAIAMGAFDLPTGLRIGKHIYVADKGDYYEIEGPAPQYPADG
jgi:hypothetical protein